MYSILIRDDKEPSKWSFHLTEDEAVWTGTKAEAQAEVNKLLATVTSNKIKVVHNTTLTLGATIEDVTE